MASVVVDVKRRDVVHIVDFDFERIELLDLGEELYAVGVVAGDGDSLHVVYGHRHAEADAAIGRYGDTRIAGSLHVSFGQEPRA